MCPTIWYPLHMAQRREEDATAEGDAHADSRPQSHSTLRSARKRLPAKRLLLSAIIGWLLAWMLGRASVDSFSPARQYEDSFIVVYWLPGAKQYRATSAANSGSLGFGERAEPVASCWLTRDGPYFKADSALSAILFPLPPAVEFQMWARWNDESMARPYGLSVEKPVDRAAFAKAVQDELEQSRAKPWLLDCLRGATSEVHPSGILLYLLLIVYWSIAAWALYSLMRFSAQSHLDTPEDGESAS